MCRVSYRRRNKFCLKGDGVAREGGGSGGGREGDKFFFLASKFSPEEANTVFQKESSVWLFL